MIKTFSPSGWALNSPCVSLIPLADRGLLGRDRHDFSKMASEAAAHDIARLADDWDPGLTPILVNSQGATEFYGPNRNGDGYRADMQRKRAFTYVKYARWYHNHANRDPSKSYGLVKYAWFNEKMARTQLVVGLFNNIKTAQEHGGLLAATELEMLARNQDLATSMAAGVPFDKCSSCGNEATSPAGYCLGIHEGGHCFHGGCRHNLAKIARDGHHLHVDNPGEVIYHDISKVDRGADPTSWGFRFDLGEKIASDGVWIGGAAHAEHLGLVLPRSVWSAHDPLLLMLPPSLTKTAELVQDLRGQLPTDPEALICFHPVFRKLAQIPLLPCRDERSRRQLTALAEEGVLLSLDEYAQWRGRPQKAAAAWLPTAVSGLLADGRLSQAYHNRDVKLETARPEDRTWASKYAADRRLDPENMRKRALLASATKGLPPLRTVEKAAATGDSDRQLAEEYSVYLLEGVPLAANACRQSHALTAAAAFAQNYVEDSATSLSG